MLRIFARPLAILLTALAGPGLAEAHPAMIADGSIVSREARSAPFAAMADVRAEMDRRFGHYVRDRLPALTNTALPLAEEP